MSAAEVGAGPGVQRRACIGMLYCVYLCARPESLHQFHAKAFVRVGCAVVPFAGHGRNLCLRYAHHGCIYLYIYIYINIYTYKYMHTSYILLCVCIYIIFIYIHTCVCVYVHMPAPPSPIYII